MHGLSKLKLFLCNLRSKTPANFPRGIVSLALLLQAAPAQLGFLQPLAPFGRFALSQPLLISLQALPRLRPGKFSLSVWLSPRPVTHQHVTRAWPTSPGTPRPFYCTRPSATLGSGHRPAARSWTLGPPAHTRCSPLFLRLGPSPLPDSEAATWDWARNLPHTALPFSSAHHLSPTGRPRPGNFRQDSTPMLNAPAHGAALHAMLRRCCYLRSIRGEIPIVVVLR